ncbi:hypothetical protein [Streptomyces sp. DT195]|uniref:hypothetical protein n=1 Tax=Streptomyces sp. DT195 TaxID=3393419 RepID=UPI003CF7B1AC
MTKTMPKPGRLLDDDESFAVLGIDRHHPAVFEDGRRSSAQLAPGEWEWWYMDAHFSNGYFAVASLHLSAPDKNGVSRPTIGLNIARGNEKLVNQRLPFSVDQLTTAVDRADTAIGSSFFRSEDGLDRYRIFVDPEQNNGNGLDIELVRTVPSYRPGTGRWEADDHHFSWFCAVPGGIARGTLFVDGEAVEVEGNGYHDHNWGDVPMDHLLGDWLWGRAEVDGTTVVSASVRFRESAGGEETPLLYVARDEDVLIDAFNDQLVCLEGVRIPHPDTGKKISSDCIYIVEQDGRTSTVRFDGRRTVVAAFPFANSSDEWETWYARYLASVTLDVESRSGARIRATAHGTLENMDFFGRRRDEIAPERTAS